MSIAHEILCKLSLEGDVSISFSFCVIFESWASLGNCAPSFLVYLKKMRTVLRYLFPLGSCLPITLAVPGSSIWKKCYGSRNCFGVRIKIGHTLVTLMCLELYLPIYLTCQWEYLLWWHELFSITTPQIFINGCIKLQPCWKWSCMFWKSFSLKPLEFF